MIYFFYFRAAARSAAQSISMRAINLLFLLCPFLQLMLAAGPGRAQNRVLSSPDGQLRAELSPAAGGKPLRYALQYRGAPVLQGSLELSLDSRPAGSRWRLISREQDSRYQYWEPLYGERSRIPEHYRQWRLHFRSTGAADLSLTLILRAYDEGFAYRYVLEKGSGALRLEAEHSLFRLAGDARAWVSATAQGPFAETRVSAVQGAVERPLTLQLGDSLFAALGEAGLVDFPRMKFVHAEGTALESRLDGPVEDSVLRSPWRYVLLAGSAGGLLERNYLLANLNAPNRITDPSWIRPGKVIREATLATAGGLACIDFAAAAGLQYVELDAGWYGREDRDSSDATRVALDPARSKGPLDLPRLIAYGREKGVGIILYVNRIALERQLDTLLPLYASWGVRGMKFGFVRVGPARWTRWLHQAVRDAAEHKLMVDIHDEYRPTGYSRSYPNLMTQEGIRGDEESPSTEQTLVTLFTRMIAGAADNTNCYFTSRVEQKMGGHAAQLAKAVCLYSPWQFLFWYDRPKASPGAASAREGVILPVPELDFFARLPTVWDDTRVIEGRIGAYATIARRHGQDWFLGSLCGREPHRLSLRCDFLEPGRRYQALIYADDADAGPTGVGITRMLVTRASTLDIRLDAGRGAAIRFSPLNARP